MGDFRTSRIFFSSNLVGRLHFLPTSACRKFFFKITTPPPPSPPQELNGRPLKEPQTPGCKTKIFIKKNIRLKALIPADNKEVNFLYENNLPKDLKSKDHCQLRSQATTHHLAIFNNWFMRGSSFKEIKLSKQNH